MMMLLPFEERIRHERARMSRSFARLADYLLDSYIEASFMTASEMAHVLNLDAATVVRFAQHLGYSGFPQLQQEIRQKVKRDILLRPPEAEAVQTASTVASGSLRELARDLEQTRLGLDSVALDQLVEALGMARRVFVAADPLAQPAARFLANYLEEGGVIVSLASPDGYELARMLHLAGPEDLFLAIEVSGASSLVANALAEAQSRNIPCAAIVGAASLASARHANLILSVQVRASTTFSAVLVSALVSALIQAFRWKFPGKFSGSEKTLAELSRQIQQPDHPSTR